MKQAAMLLVVFLAACRSAPAPPSGPKPTGDAGLPVQWFVWTSGEAGPTTYRVSAQGEVLGTATGAWIGVPDSRVAAVWEFDQEGVKIPQSDCDCEFEAEENGGDTSACVQEAEIAVGVLRPFPTGPVIDLPPAKELGSETQGVSAVVDGNAGPFAFVTVCVDEYACGAAHGGIVCAQTIYDLRTGAEVEIAAVSVAPLRGPDMLSFVREAFEDEHEAEELAEEDVVLTWVAPSYERQAVPRIEEQYTAPTCYACSDGLWDSYTLSSRRTVETLPKALKTWFAATRPPSAKFLAEVGQVAGWSVVPADAQLRSHLDGVFTR